MSGSGNIQGTRYQHRVVVFVYSHILAKRRLEVLEHNDIPIAVSLETGGFGDDLRVEFEPPTPSLEIQVKHGLERGALLAFVRGLSAKGQRDESVGLIVDRTAPQWMRDTLKKDLARLRFQRDEPTAKTAELIAELGADAGNLKRVVLHEVDVDDRDGRDTSKVLSLLHSCLEKGVQVDAAFAELVLDAERRGGSRYRCDRVDLIAVLNRVGIQVRRPAEEERLHQELDTARRFIHELEPETALSVLASLERTLPKRTDVGVRYRLLHLKAAATLHKRRPNVALQFANDAIELDPTRPDAFRVAAMAQLELGALGKARALSREALQIAPRDPQAWVVAHRVAVADQSVNENPPAEVIASVPYRQELAQSALVRCEWNEAISVTQSVDIEDEPDPFLLYLRGVALINEVKNHADSAATQLARLAEQVATRLLDTVRDNHPLKPKALVIRSDARRVLGRTTEADADLVRANSGSRADSDAAQRRAAAFMNAGRFTEAVETLTDPAFAHEPLIIAQRCRALVGLGDCAAAKQELVRLMNDLPNAKGNEVICFAIADAAHLLRNEEALEAALSAAIAAGSTNIGHCHLLQGRLAALRGDLELAAGEFEASHAILRKHQILWELGVEQADSGRAADAVKTLDRIPQELLPEPVMRRLANALFELGEWQRVQRIVDTFTKGVNPTPEWAVRTGAQLALRRDDPAAAVRLLSELVVRGEHVSPAIRINLAIGLIDLERFDDARVQLEIVASDHNLNAVEFVKTAQMFRQIGDRLRSIEVAARGFRTIRDNAELHRVLASLVLENEAALPVHEVVGPDTSVRLDTGARGSWLTVVADEKPDPTRQEIDVNGAKLRGLVGLGLGSVVANPSRPSEQTRIGAIVPRVVFEVRSILANYGDVFPNEDFFAASYHVGDFSSPRDLQPFIDNLSQQKEGAVRLFKMYQENTFPLAFMTRPLGLSIPDLIDRMAMGGSGELPLLMTEWADREGRDESISAAIAAHEVVLTRSALHVASQLGLLRQLADAFRIVAPRTLLRDVSGELAAAEEHVRRGMKLMIGSDLGPRLAELSPSDEQLIRVRDQLRSQLDWLKVSATIAPRSLVQLENEDDEVAELHTTIGPSATDGVEMVRDGLMTLYADDLGLRALLRGRGKGRSFSTVALLSVLRKRGIIDDAQWITLLLRLLERRHGAISPSSSLLFAGLHEFKTDPRRLRHLMAAMVGFDSNLFEAVGLVSEVVKRDSLELSRVGTQHIVELALDAMARRWPPPLCARALAEAVRQECHLLPDVIRETSQAVRQFLQRTGAR